MKTSELTDRLGAQLEGDPELEITGAANLEGAGPRDLSFIANRRWAEAAVKTRAGALLATPDLAALVTGTAAQPPRAILIVERPELAMAQAVALLRPPWRPAPGVHPTASIDPTAEVGRDCHIGAFVAIGAGCKVGDGSVLHPHVVLYPGVWAGPGLLAHAHVVIREGTRLGARVTLQPGVVIGGDGFGFTRREDGSHAKIPQVGVVEIGDDVEIQANSCVDRASLAVTRIGTGVKIDNLSQVAHNCELDRDVLLCAQVGLAGHTVVEQGAVLAGQVGVAGHCRVGRGAIITAQSGTHGDLEAGKMYSGSPAFDHGAWLRSTATFARLGEMQRELRQLRRELDEVKRKAS